MKFVYSLGVTWLVVIIALVVGWGMNVYALITHHDSIGLFIARVCGIFIAPLGGILGYF